jgi:hypothetical protein
MQTFWGADVQLCTPLNSSADEVNDHHRPLHPSAKESSKQKVSSAPELVWTQWRRRNFSPYQRQPSFWSNQCVTLYLDCTAHTFQRRSSRSCIHQRHWCLFQIALLHCQPILRGYIIENHLFSCWQNTTRITHFSVLLVIIITSYMHQA